jgi:hypothetical protein
MNAAAEETSRELATAETSLVQLVSKAELDQQITTALANRAASRSSVASAWNSPRSRADRRRVHLRGAAQGRRADEDDRGPERALRRDRRAFVGQLPRRRARRRGRPRVHHGAGRVPRPRNEHLHHVRGPAPHHRQVWPLQRDMISTTGNAACSIALRNAVFKGVPKAFWNDIYEAARKVCMGDAKTLANRRSEALAYFAKLGAPSEKVFATLGVAGIEDVTLEHLADSQRHQERHQGRRAHDRGSVRAATDAAGDKPQSRADQAKERSRARTPFRTSTKPRRARRSPRRRRRRTRRQVEGDRRRLQEPRHADRARGRAQRPPRCTF